MNPGGRKSHKWTVFLGGCKRYGEERVIGLAHHFGAVLTRSPMTGIFRKSDYVYFASQRKAALENRIVLGFKLGRGVPKNVF
jgi:hypothetical protein